MKKYIGQLFITLFAFSLIIACGKPKPLSPDEVAVRLYNELTSGDLRFVKRHLYFPNPVDYEVFCEYLDMAVMDDGYWERTDGYKPDYRAVDTKIYGDEAYVELQGVTPTNTTASITVRLLFIDDMWKVDGNHGVLHSVDK